MSNVLYILAGVYIIAMGYFLKTVPGESGPFLAGDERVKQQATPVRRLIVIALGLLMLVYGVFEVVQARQHRDGHGPVAAAERLKTSHAVSTEIRARQVLLRRPPARG